MRRPGKNATQVRDWEAKMKENGPIHENKQIAIIGRQPEDVIYNDIYIYIFVVEQSQSRFKQPALRILDCFEQPRFEVFELHGFTEPTKSELLDLWPGKAW